MGAIEPTIQALADQVGSACQVVAICGRNKRLIKRLEAKPYPAGMKVTIQGFVDNMPEWMTACDMIVTKAGPGTIAESFICGLPVLLNGFVPCQEEGNVPFVVKNKVRSHHVACQPCVCELCMAAVGLFSLPPDFNVSLPNWQLAEACGASD